MDFINVKEIKTLLKEQQKPCVSLFLPTHRKGKEIKQDSIRLKNLLSRAEQGLKAQGIETEGINEFLEPAKKFLDDPYFWHYQSDGLAMFLAPNEFYYYCLPLEFEELIIVSNKFYITPLVPLLTSEGHFFILDLNQKRLRMFQGSQFSISEVDLKKIPTSIDEALKYDCPERQLQFNTKTSSPRGERPAIFFGQGIETDGDIHKKNILRFFQMVDKGVSKLIYKLTKGVGSPLILAGTEYLISIYRKANSYPNLMKEEFNVNPKSMNVDELHKEVWKIVQHSFQKAQEESLAKYKQLTNTRRTSSNLEEIIKEAYTNRIDSFFITKGLQRWGIFNPKSNKITIHQKMETGDEELLDIAVSQIILHDGAVYTLDAEDMVDNAQIATLFRY
ncbi:MAG: hypothetical protein V1872_12905 [bacterium]